MGTVEEEADESAFWIEFGLETNLMKRERVADLMDEADQLVAIFVSSINTARGKARAAGKAKGIAN
jgi:hypothetical protein